MAFPRISAGKGRVTIYSYTHGIGSRKTEPTKEVIDRIRSEVQRFGPNDYAVVEGFNPIYHTGIPPEMWKRSPWVWNTDYLLPQFGLDTAKCERPEWYKLPFLTNAPEHEKIRAYNESLLREHKPQVIETLQRSGEIGIDAELLRASTEFDWDRWQTLKESAIQGFTAIPGVSEEGARTYVEEETTFRSLLVARTSTYRADTL